MIMPLVTLPYLIKVIGIEKYGAYSIVFSLIQYVILFSAYGFSFSTTKQISQYRENKEFVNEVFNSTLICRFIIAFVTTVPVFLLCAFFYPEEYSLMFLLGVGMILGDIVNPVWLYQGMEKMRFMTFVNLISKTIFTILIFVGIRQESDYIYVTFLNSCGYLVSGIVSLIFAIKFFNIKLSLPKKNHIKKQFIDGWYIFLSTLSMNLYRNSNVLILSFFLGEGLVGIYSGAEKVIKAVQAVTNPISNALFPHVAKSFKHSSLQSKLHMIFKLCKYMSILLIVISGGAYIGAPILTKILLDNVDNAIGLIHIMCPVIFFGGINYIMGIVGLVNLNAQRSFFIYVMISGIISIIMLIIATPIIGLQAAAYSMSLTEILLFCMCSYKLYIIHKCKH